MKGKEKNLQGKESKGEEEVERKDQTINKIFNS